MFCSQPKKKNHLPPGGHSFYIYFSLLLEELCFRGRNEIIVTDSVCEYSILSAPKMDGGVEKGKKRKYLLDSLVSRIAGATV